MTRCVLCLETLTSTLQHEHKKPSNLLAVTPYSDCGAGVSSDKYVCDAFVFPKLIYCHYADTIKDSKSLSILYTTHPEDLKKIFKETQHLFFWRALCK